MAVSLVGTPGTAASASPVTGNYGQSPTAGNLLVAVLGWWSTAIETFSPTTSTSGWTRLVSPATGNNPSGTSHAGVDMWWKAAAGGDAQPVFTQASGATALVTCLIYELSGANTTTPLDTSGIYQSGATALTTPPTMTPATAGNVAASGEFALSCFIQDDQAATLRTWTELGTGWTSAFSDGSTSQSGHSQFNYQPGPASGSPLSDSGHFNTSTANTFAAAMVAVIAAGGTSATVTLTTPNLVLAAPLVTPQVSAAVALTTPDIELAAPLVTPASSPVVALTTPDLALAAPLVSPQVSAAVNLTAPNLALAAPLVTPRSSPTVGLTTPNLALAAPPLTPAATFSATVALTTPNLVLAAPPLVPAGPSVTFIAGSAATDWEADGTAALWAAGAVAGQWEAGLPGPGGGPPAYGPVYTATYEAGFAIVPGAAQAEWTAGPPVTR